MLKSLSKSRHIVEKSDKLIRVTLPSKSNTFRVLFVCLWFLMWGCMLYALLYIAVTFNKAIEIGRNSTSPAQPGGVFFMVSIGWFFFLLVILGFGVFGIYRFGWLTAGKEVIEATLQTLTITKQIFRWKRSREYASEKVSGLRTNTQPISMFRPGKRVKKFLGGPGMIAFDYRGRTFTFGLEISEAEAEQIILAIKEGLPQQHAG